MGLGVPQGLVWMRPTVYAARMEIIVWIGTGITLIGLAGLIWVILAAKRAQGAGLDDSALKARLQRLTAANLGALAVSAIGLMCVVLGVILA